MKQREEIPIWAVFPMIFGALMCLLVCIVGPLFIVIEIGGHIRDLGWANWLTPVVSVPLIGALWGVCGTTATWLFRELFS